MGERSTYIAVGAAPTAVTIGAVWLLAEADVIWPEWWIVVAMAALVVEATVLLFFVGAYRGHGDVSPMSDPHEVYIETSARSVSSHSTTMPRTGPRDRFQIRFFWAALPPGLTAFVLLFLI